MSGTVKTRNVPEIRVKKDLKSLFGVRFRGFPAIGHNWINPDSFGCRCSKITVGRRQVGVYTPHLPPAINDMVLGIATLPKFESRASA